MVRLVLSPEEVQKAIHDSVADRYKEPQVIRSVSVSSAPTIGTDLTISFSLLVDLLPAIDELAREGTK
jgi:hypothetical protein